MINISRWPSLSLTQIVLPGAIFSLGRPGGQVQLFIYFVYQNHFGAKTNPWPTGWQMSVLGIRLLLFLKTLIWLANFIQTHCKQPTPTGTNVEGWEATPSSYHQHLTCRLDILNQLLDLDGCQVQLFDIDAIQQSSNAVFIGCSHLLWMAGGCLEPRPSPLPSIRHCLHHPPQENTLLHLPEGG